MHQGPTFYQRLFDRLPLFLKHRIHPLEAAVEAFVRSAASESKRGLIVDAGAGENRFSHFFQHQRYLAIDAGLGDSSWDYSQLDIQGRLEALPLRSEVASAVIHTQVLEHVPQPCRVLREMQRILQPAGRLYLTAPQGWHEHQQPHDFYRFTRYALRDLLEGAGFHVVRIEPMGGYFHYLGHRLTYIPKVLFQDRSWPARILFFPVELGALLLFCFLGPLICYYLDALDRRREFTLCYRCVAEKPANER